jgi:hypothetical protein
MPDWTQIVVGHRPADDHSTAQSRRRIMQEGGLARPKTQRPHRLGDRTPRLIIQSKRHRSSATPRHVDRGPASAVANHPPRSPAHDCGGRPCQHSRDGEFQKSLGTRHDKAAAGRKMSKRRREDRALEARGGKRHGQHPNDHHQNVLGGPRVTNDRFQMRSARRPSRKRRWKTRYRRKQEVHDHGGPISQARS